MQVQVVTCALTGPPEIGAPHGPLLGLINLLEHFTELKLASHYSFTAKDTNEQPDEEAECGLKGSGAQELRAQSGCATVLARTGFLAAFLFTGPGALRTVLVGFVGASHVGEFD